MLSQHYLHLHGSVRCQVVFWAGCLLDKLFQPRNIKPVLTEYIALTLEHILAQFVSLKISLSRSSILLPTHQCYTTLSCQACILIPVSVFHIVFNIFTNSLHRITPDLLIIIIMETKIKQEEAETVAK